MLIVNADDFGRSREETDIVVACHRATRITSTSAMVFMSDSARAAAIAGECGLDVGLHLNLSEPFTGSDVPHAVQQAHRRIVRFLTTHKYAVLFYNPFLRHDFEIAVAAQIGEFERLYGRAPSHVDGHQHQHLCANVLIDGLLSRGQTVRRSFSFWPGEKSALNRFYRTLVDRRLARRHALPDYFFSLEQCLANDRLARVLTLAQTAAVELMTHPIRRGEYQYLMSDAYLADASRLLAGTYCGACR